MRLALAIGVLSVVTACGRGPDASSPAEPTPSPEPPPSAAGPAVHEVTPAASAEAPSLPPPRAIGLDVPDRVRDRLEPLLERERGIEGTVSAATEIVRPDGSIWVWLLFQAPGTELCIRESVAEGEPRAAARRRCATEDLVRDDGGDVVDAACVRVFLARFEITLLHEDAPRLAAVEELFVSCRLDAVRAFRVVDADDDERPEVEIDYWGTGLALTPGNAVGIWSRMRGWMLREGEDLAERFVVDLAFPEERGETVASRLEWRDADGDGRTDIVVHQVDLTVPEDPTPCRIDAETGWPEGARETSEGAPALCPVSATHDRVYLYDAATDRYIQQ